MLKKQRDKPYLLESSNLNKEELKKRVQTMMGGTLDPLRNTKITYVHMYDNLILNQSNRNKIKMLLKEDEGNFEPKVINKKRRRTPKKPTTRTQTTQSKTKKQEIFVRKDDNTTIPQMVLRSGKKSEPTKKSWFSKAMLKSNRKSSNIPIIKKMEVIRPPKPGLISINKKSAEKPKIKDKLNVKIFKPDLPEFRSLNKRKEPEDNLVDPEEKKNKQEEDERKFNKWQEESTTKKEQIPIEKKEVKIIRFNIQKIEQVDNLVDSEEKKKKQEEDERKFNEWQEENSTKKEQIPENKEVKSIGFDIHNIKKNLHNELKDLSNPDENPPSENILENINQNNNIGNKAQNLFINPTQSSQDEKREMQANDKGKKYR